MLNEILCRATNNFVKNDKKNFQKTRPFPQKPGALPESIPNIQNRTGRRHGRGKGTAPAQKSVRRASRNAQTHGFFSGFMLL